MSILEKSEKLLNILESHILTNSLPTEVVLAMSELKTEINNENKELIEMLNAMSERYLT